MKADEGSKMQRVEQAAVSARGKAVLLGRAIGKEVVDLVDSPLQIPGQPGHVVIALSADSLLLQLIADSRCFALNGIGEDLLGDIEVLRDRGAQHLERPAILHLGGGECEKIDCPCLTRALWVKECEVVHLHPLPQHRLVISKVVRETAASRQGHARAYPVHQDKTLKGTTIPGVHYER